MAVLFSCSCFFVDRHLMEQVHRMEVEGRVWLLMRKPAKPFVNPSLEAFLNDRRNPELRINKTIQYRFYFVSFYVIFLFLSQVF